MLEKSNEFTSEWILHVGANLQEPISSFGEGDLGDGVDRLCSFLS